jgi:hypothetical protein
MPLTLLALEAVMLDVKPLIGIDRPLTLLALEAAIGREAVILALMCRLTHWH